MNMRRWNGILAVCTIAVGLSVHRGVLPLSATARDVLGDALWAMMIVWLTGVLAPRASLRARALAALSICFVVELSQLARTPALDALRRTLPGHLVLGSGFDARDFVAYTAGVVLAIMVLSASARGTLHGEEHSGC